MKLISVLLFFSRYILHSSFSIDVKILDTRDKLLNIGNIMGQKKMTQLQGVK
jgi:hypothetical protein